MTVSSPTRARSSNSATGVGMVAMAGSWISRYVGHSIPHLLLACSRFWKGCARPPQRPGARKERASDKRVAERLQRVRDAPGEVVVEMMGTVGRQDVAGRRIKHQPTSVDQDGAAIGVGHPDRQAGA